MATVEYYLCSGTVIKHFPDLEKSKPFKSGYDFDKDEDYYVIATTDFNTIKKYYDDVIEPYNQKSNVDDIDFWMKEICTSFIDEAQRGCLSKCRTCGIFKAIEHIWGLTNDKNRAFAIYVMAGYYGLTPIEFINKVAR